MLNALFKYSLQVNIDVPNSSLIPKKGTDGSAGYDLFNNEPYPVVLNPGDRLDIETSVKIMIPEGYFGRICPRSGLAFKNGIDVLAGVIDSDYRGTIKVILINLGQDPFTTNPGDKIAQIIFQKYENVLFNAISTLDDTKRGSGGFGSTGS